MNYPLRTNDGEGEKEFQHTQLHSQTTYNNK